MPENMVGSIAAPHDTETQDPVLTVDLHQLREEGREKDNNYMCVWVYILFATHTTTRLLQTQLFKPLAKSSASNVA